MPEFFETAIMRFSDRLAAADSYCDHTVITLPNMDFIPQPVIGRVKVKLRVDGRFGVEDPIQWPQLLSFKYSHFSCILREPSNAQDPRKLIWWKLNSQDFIPTHRTIVSSLGTLRPAFREALDALVLDLSARVRCYQVRHSDKLSHLNFCETSMRTSLNCLSFLITYRDLLVQVVNVQWYWLECDTWIHWNEHILPVILKPLPSPIPVDHNLMGTFTSDPTAAFKLFSGGIPVWFLHLPDVITSETSIVLVVLLTHPDKIEVDTGSFGSTLYAGKAGEAHLMAVSMGGHTYIDIPKVFLSSQHETSQKLSKAAVATPSAFQSINTGSICSQIRTTRTTPCK